MQTIIKVKGMSCNHCKLAVEGAAKSIEGVTAAEVDLAAKTLKIESSQAIDKAALKAAIEEEGFQLA